jgi:[ribosomal protein S18]-alanine N-acetyltransferase
MIEQITFRRANVEDIDQIHAIEHVCFPNPWSRTAFINEIVNNHFATYFIVEIEEKQIGYCGVWVIIDEAHITNIAILPEYQGHKFGEALLRNVMMFAKASGAKTMSLEVRVSNLVAQNLYRKLGFQEGGIRKNYYSDNGEDAIVMWVNLDE